MEDRKLSRLLAALKGGDLTAFDEIYRAMGPPLYTVLCRMVRDRALAEDLLQELFLKLYRAPPADIRKPRAYLFQMARNLALDALRKSRPEVALGDAPEAMAYHDADRNLEIEEALDTLEPTDAQLVTLHVNGGLKFRELAEVLEMPLGTVLWRYRRAIGRLQTFLNGGTSHEAW